MGIAFLLDFYYVCSMWIKQIKKQNTPKGKAFYQYQLTQSSRIEGKVQHIAVLYLGSHPLLSEKENRSILANLLKDRINGQTSLVEAPGELIKLADEYYERYLIKNPDNQPVKKTKEPPVTYDEVDLSSTQVENTREIGCEWVVKQMVERLDVAGALQRKGWGKKQASLAVISLISRAVAAFSEHKTAQWIAKNSGLMELFDFPKNYTPTRHHLYHMATALYGHKDFLEDHLYQRTLSMFGVEDKVAIFDLTNTYFEGVKAGSEMARFGGNSKEKRNDCKQMVLAAVVNSYGMLKYSQIYEGNMSDTATLEGVIESLSQQAGKGIKEQTLVMDAGIATEENLKFLHKKELKYICVSPTKLKDYHALVEGNTVEIQDKREGKIDLKVIQPQDYHDTWMYIKSQGKQAKERSINEQKKTRFEKELHQVKGGIHKKGGTKQYGKVMERIGRIKERYPGIHKYYKLTVNHDENYKATDFHWEIKEVQPKEDPDHGVYFLRTNYEKVVEQQMWQIYNTIREVEATFRTLKNDLRLRPVYHQEDEYMQAHLFLGVLAYQVVAAIRYQLKQHGINHDWTNIVRIMNTQKVMTVKQQAKTKDISLRLCGKPIKEAQDIYNALNFKNMPFAAKKFVVYH